MSMPDKISAFSLSFVIKSLVYITLATKILLKVFNMPCCSSMATVRHVWVLFNLQVSLEKS